MKVANTGFYCIPAAVLRLNIDAVAKLMYAVVSAILSSDDPNCSEESIAATMGITAEQVVPTLLTLREAGLLNIIDDGNGVARLSLTNAPCFDGINLPDNYEE